MAPKPRLHALFAYWQERLKHACKKIPPWLDIAWQETNPFPEPVEGNISPKTPVEKKGFLGASP